jgi:hypothetical protein
MTNQTKTKHTNQTAFNRVWATFMIGKAPKSTVGDQCVYGAPDTVGCAIACLLSPESRALTASYNGSVSSLCVDRPSVDEELNGCDLGLLMRLQAAHDNTPGMDMPQYFRSKMRAALKAVAREYRLSVPTGKV